MGKWLISVLIGLFAFGQLKTAQAQELKIGYVLQDEIFNNYEKTKDLDTQLNKKGEKKQVEREEKVKEINKLKDELALLSEKGKTAKQKDYEDKVRELKDFDQQATMDLRKERDGLARSIFEEIDAVIKEYSQKNGYDLILEGRMLYYKSPKLDLTNEILKTLNSRYKK